MKKALGWLLSLFVAGMATAASVPTNGTSVGAAIIPQGNFPSHAAYYGHGGWRSVTTTNDLALIDPTRMETGMAAYVTSTSKLYTYDGANWNEFVSGGASSLQAVTKIGNITSNGLVVINVGGYTSFVANVISGLASPDTTIIGENAGQTVTTSAGLAVFGRNAGQYMVDQNYSTAIGVESMRYGAHGGINTAVGHQTMMQNTNGSYNTVVGAGAGKYLLSGADNTLIGPNNFADGIQGSANTTLGSTALRNLRWGDHNVSIGYESLRQSYSNSSGNVAIGSEALWTLGAFTVVPMASYNIGIGYFAGSNLTNGQGNIYLGANSQASAQTATNEFVAGSTSFPINDVYIRSASGQATRWNTSTRFTTNLLCDVTAVGSNMVVNYQTMTNYVAGATPTGFLKADGSVTWTGNQNAGGTIITNLGGFWMGGVLVTNIDTNAVSGLASSILNVSNRVVTLEGSTNNYALLNANNYYASGKTNNFDWVLFNNLSGNTATVANAAIATGTVTRTATAGYDIVNWQTMTNYVAGRGFLTNETLWLAASNQVLWADGRITWTGNQNAGGTIITNLGGFWLGSILVTNIDTNAVVDLEASLLNVSNRVVTLEGLTNTETLASVTLRGSNTSQNVWLEGNHSTIGIRGTESWGGAEIGMLNLGRNEGTRISVNAASGDINGGWLLSGGVQAFDGSRGVLNFGYGAGVQTQFEAVGSANFGTVYASGLQYIERGGGSFNIGSVDGATQRVVNILDGFSGQGVINGGNLRPYAAQYMTGSGSINYGCLENGYVQTNSGKGSFILGGRGTNTHDYATLLGDGLVSKEANSVNARKYFENGVWIGALYGTNNTLDAVCQRGSNTTANLQLRGKWDSIGTTTGTEIWDSGTSGGLNLGYLATGTRTNVSSYGSINMGYNSGGVQSQNGTAGCMNGGWVLGGAQFIDTVSGSMNFGRVNGTQWMYGQGSFNFGYLDAGQLQTNSGNGSFILGGPGVNTHDYSLLLGAGLTSQETNSVNARKYFENGTALVDKYAALGTGNTYAGGTSQNFALATVTNNASASTDIVNWRTLTNYVVNTALTNDTLATVTARGSTTTRNVTLGGSWVSIGTNAGTLVYGGTDPTGQLNLGVLSSFSTRTNLGSACINGGWTHGVMSIGDQSRGCINWGVCDSPIATMIMSNTVQGSMNFGYIPNGGNYLYTSGNGSFNGGLNQSNTHDRAFTWGIGQHSKEADAMHARKYFENGTSLDAKYTTYPAATNIAAAVATNVVNGYIVGSGYMYMTENVGTSILYHVTMSGTHTNKIGEFYSL